MVHIEKNQTKSYIKKDDKSIPELTLRLRYMIEDFDELIKAELNNKLFFSKPQLERQSSHS